MMNNPKIDSTEIQAIFFDLDGTLRHNQPDSHDFFFGHAIRLGLEDRPELHQQAFRWAHYYWSNSKLLRQDIETYPGERGDDFWENYARRYLEAYSGSAELAAELAPAVRQHMHENYAPANEVIPGTLEILSQLQENGYILGLVTNRNDPVEEELVKLELAPYFEFTLTAGAAQAWKPDARIFETALEMGGVRAAETIYVGDNYYADIEGSQGAGLLPVLVDRHGLFPEAACPVVSRVAELPGVLSGLPEISGI